MKKPEIVGGRITFTQEADSCDSSELQILHIDIEDSGAGKFLAMETTRWAFDDISEVVDVLNQVKSAFGINTPPTQQGE